MKAHRRPGPRWIAAACVCAVAGAHAVSAQEVVASWRVTRGSVRIVCPMTIGGTFEARTSAIGGQVALSESARSGLSGDLDVDLTTLTTGIGFRDDHMRDTYLEVQKGQGYDHAVVSNLALDGADPASAVGRVAFTGTLLLHGATRPVHGEATIHRTSSGVQVDARFAVRLSDFGIAKPQYLGVGVRDEVQADIEFEAAAVAAPSTVEESR